MFCGCWSTESDTRDNIRRSSTTSTTKNNYCISIAVLVSCVTSVVLLSVILTLYIYVVGKTSPVTSVILIRSGELCGTGTGTDDSPLILTPYIRTGRIKEAQALSWVEPIKGVQSYSGYFTVNATFDANIFFWFFPHANYESDFESIPLILYLQGGPGLSSLFGLFFENGPFEIYGDGIGLRKTSWRNTHHILYLDSPIGTGFSFANSSDAFANGQNDVVRDLYKALLQFFTLFPKFQRCDFYLAGTSYSGKTLPLLGYKIHQENYDGESSSSPEVRMNLKGLMIGSGYFDGLIQDEYSDFYYQLGLLEKRDWKEFKEIELRMKAHVKKGEFGKAKEALAILVVNNFTSLTGFDDLLMFNALDPKTPPSVSTYEHFLNSSCIRSLLHAGNQTYNLLSIKVYSAITEQDFYFSPKKELERLLNANYRILIYSAQFDRIVTHVGQSEYLSTLSWHGKKNFEEATRKLWKVNDTVAGYVKKYDNLVHIFIRNAGHTACYDQPNWCEDMIHNFTRNKL